jgi:hypothetical protein
MIGVQILVQLKRRNFAIDLWRSKIDYVYVWVYLWKKPSITLNDYMRCRQ